MNIEENTEKSDSTNFENSTNSTQNGNISSPEYSIDPNSQYISLCLVGCVSAGKSTILNAFFGQDYAQCKIKRTTMVPYKFVETDNYNGTGTTIGSIGSIGSIDSFETINRTIASVNDTVYTHTQAGNEPILENYGDELTFRVPKTDMNLNEKIKLCIYDIPGLNDAKTKNTYYTYLEQNFHKFNIILFVIDIHSGLNTTDEMDILNFLVRKIKTFSENNNAYKKIKLLAVVNKADDMQLDNECLKVLGELGEMFEHISQTIKQEFKNAGIGEHFINCIPICGLDAHLYRVIKRFRDINKLSDENILRIGVNEEGSKFRKLSKDVQRIRVEHKIHSKEFVDDMIKLSGFSQIEKAIGDYVQRNGVDAILDNILFEYSQLPPLLADTLLADFEVKINTLVKLVDFEELKPVFEHKMSKLRREFNSIVCKKIKEHKRPMTVYVYYNELMDTLRNNQHLVRTVGTHYDLNVWVPHVVDRILKLVKNEFKCCNLPISTVHTYMKAIENIGALNKTNVNQLIESLESNVKKNQTFIYDFEIEQIIETLELFSISDNYLEFVRYFMMVWYLNINSVSLLIKKQLFLSSHGEIPLKEFINDLRLELKSSFAEKIKIYKKGVCVDTKDKDITMESYYIELCRKMGDTSNFCASNIFV